MKRSFEDLVTATNSEYDCECSFPDGDKALRIDCFLLYGRGGDVHRNFERAIFVRVPDPVSSRVILSSASWGDTIYNPDTDAFHSTFLYDEDGLLRTCTGTDMCAPCEVCPGASTYSMDCS